MNFYKFLLISISFFLATEVANAQVLPSLTILEPQEGQLYLEGEEIVARFAVSNFSFVTGHGHLWVDVEEFAHDEAQEITNIDPTSLGQLPKGTHNLKLELTRNKHISFNPPVRASVNFVVGEPLPLEFQETAKAPPVSKASPLIAGAVLLLGVVLVGAWFFRRKFL